jgi:hypothetical protein
MPVLADSATFLYYLKRDGHRAREVEAFHGV